MQYILTGDVQHPGRISVEADTLLEALAKAEEGQFIVYDEQDDCLAFIWNGDTDGTSPEEN